MADWETVLKHFEINSYFDNGLTLPFLIGARTILEPDEPLETIREVVEQMCDGDSMITVMHCGNLHEYVFAFLDGTSKDMMKIYPNLYKSFGNLICTDGSLSLCSTVEEVIEEMKSKSQEILDDRTYSKNGGWGDYNEIEEQRIKELL